MARKQYTTIVVLDRKRLIEEYWEAWDRRVWGPNVRIICNPAGAAAVASVIDQIPRVKAEVAKADRRRRYGRRR